MVFKLLGGVNAKRISLFIFSFSIRAVFKPLGGGSPEEILLACRFDYALDRVRHEKLRLRLRPSEQILIVAHSNVVCNLSA